MIKSDYKDVLDRLATPVVVAEPVFPEGRNFADDFVVQYLNDSFRKTFSGLVMEGEKFSIYLPKLTHEIDWLGMANTALRSKKILDTTFYSKIYSCWLRIFMNVTDTGLLIFSAVNIDSERQREEKLRNQNARLEALTDELSLSKENLRIKLDNIEHLNSLLQYNAYHDSMTGFFT